MNISLDERVRYTTQSRIWDTHILGPLTNAAIKRYHHLGKQIGSLSTEPQAKPHKLLSSLPWHFHRGPKVVRQPKRNILKELLA